MDEATFNEYTRKSESTISAKVICDSVAPNGCRLTTMEWTYPRFIHSEIMTHRKLSKNSASSRAIPLSKMIQRIEDNPVFPIHWGKNEKGMQASEELDLESKLMAARTWLSARREAIKEAKKLEDIGIHKQIGNRILEPWMWITIIVSATNFENLFALRCHPAAEPHFQNLAYKAREALDHSLPTKLEWGEWHLPLFGHLGKGDVLEDWMIDKVSDPLSWAKVSAGRCARVSYLTHEGKRDYNEDIKLYERLSSSIPLHASPLEHPAKAIEPEKNYDIIALKTDWGNFDPGWIQLRKLHENEHVTVRVPVASVIMLP